MAFAAARARVQAVIGGAALQWAIDGDGEVIERLREDLDTVLRPRITGARPRSRGIRRPTRRSWLAPQLRTAAA
jgi:hypothetical protein